jgi:hypothetical protein
MDSGIRPLYAPKGRTRLTRSSRRSPPRKPKSKSPSKSRSKSPPREPPKQPKQPELEDEKWYKNFHSFKEISKDTNIRYALTMDSVVEVKTTDDEIIHKGTFPRHAFEWKKFKLIGINGEIQKFNEDEVTIKILYNAQNHTALPGYIHTGGKTRRRRRN